MNKIISKIAITAMLTAPLFGIFPLAASADSIGPINFESPAYALGNINGQDGWMALGASGSGCAVYDESVGNSLGTTGFGSQSFRISDAVTSGCFGDQAFAKPVVNAAGEADSTNGSFSPGILQSHFETQFDIASTMLDQQPGMHVSVSPDRGDGSRMSYLRFEDGAAGIDVFFDDVQGTSNPANFVETQVATGLSRAVPHTIKLSMDFLNGPSNDVVKVWIDGILVHTGTSWENYYRYDSEASAEQSPRIVKTVLFRESGTANAADAGKGYLIDNLSLISGFPPPTTVQVHIFKYVDGVQATAGNANNAVFPMETTFNSPNLGSVTNVPFTLSPTGWGPTDSAYEASFVGSNPGADYEADEVVGGSVVGASCAGGNPFALVGYTTGDTLAAAAAATPVATIPSFTNLQSDHYVIVWNKTCPTEIHGSKFYDINGNGAWDVGEPGLGGWTINLAGTASASQVTGAAGAYGFTNLAAGSYTLSEVMKAGWTQTKAPGPITLAVGQTLNNQDFGNSCFVSTKGQGLGFWTNKNGQALETTADFTALTNLNLVNANGSARNFGGTLPINKTALNTWLLGANATNMAYMLSAQLAAVQLSVDHGASSSANVFLPGLLPFAPITGLSSLGVISINDLIAAANAELGLHPTTVSPNAFRAYQGALKDALEKVAGGSSVQLCNVAETFSASDSAYYNGSTPAAGLYGTGPINFTWDPVTGNVTGGLYEEIVPPTTGTHYFNVVTGGTVVGSAVHLNFIRTVPNNYGPFSADFTLSGNTITGTLDGPYLFTATGAVTP